MIPGRNVAVTFDDGFHSVVENAAPELVKRGIPFTMFVPSGCLGGRPPWIANANHPSWKERVLSAAELRDVANDSLATIGSHSVTHANLLSLDTAGSQEELARSKAELEFVLGRQVELFSFPHGAHTARHVEQARQAGYRMVFTIEPSAVSGDSDLYTVGRVAADPEDWPIEFRLKIWGAYRWRCYLHYVRDVLCQ
jgi:peptidoglycan/xylan/chitin deacetylase (PgdA/CDA1 family)